MRAANETSILERYHPYRAIILFGELDDGARRAAEEVPEEALTEHMDEPDGPLDTQGLRNLLSGVLFEGSLVDALAGQTGTSQAGLEEFASSVAGLMNTLSRFANTGGHVFDLSGVSLPELVSEPVEKVTWDEIRWPSNKPIYLNFGDDLFQISDDLILEGAYVARSKFPRDETVLNIRLIARRRLDQPASMDQVAKYWYSQDHCHVYVVEKSPTIAKDVLNTFREDLDSNAAGLELRRWEPVAEQCFTIIVNALRALMPARKNAVPQSLVLPTPHVHEEGALTIHQVTDNRAGDVETIDDALTRTTEEFVAKISRYGLRAGARGKTGAHQEDIAALKRLLQSSSVGEVDACLDILDTKAAVARGVMRAVAQLDSVPHPIIHVCSFLAEQDGPGSFDAVWDWLDTTLEGLYEHLDQGNLDCPIELHSFFDTTAGRESLTLDVVVRYNRPMQPTFLWDRRIVRTKRPLCYSLPLSILVDEVDYQPRLVKQWKPSPLFHYHPERFRHTRTHIDDTLKLMASLGDALGKPEGMQAMTEPMFREMQKGSGDVPLVEKKQRPDPGAKHMGTEISFAINYNNFKAGGRQIFDLDPELVTMFKHTSVDDVPVEVLVSPFEMYYLHFGPQEELEFEEGWHVDGVYITHRPDDKLIQFLFTSRPSVDEDVTKWHTFEEPCFVLSFGKEHHELNINEAVDRVITSKAEEIEEKIGRGNKDISDEMHKLADAKGLELPVKQIVEVNEKHGRVQKGQLAERHPVMRKALDIAVNALCYLTAYPDDIVEEWPANTPERLLKAAETGPPKQKKRSASKLNALGYQKVYLCGQALKHSQVSTEGRTVRTHWRRGHWKRQPYGPKRALRKLILIRPVLVNAEKEKRDGEPLGHIYIGKNLPGPDETIH